MTATAPGWYDTGRWRELTAIVGLVSSPHAYKRSPTIVDWTPRLPGDCTELTAWAETTFQALAWPPAALERWICKTEAGRAHAVLIVNVTLAGGAVAAIVVDCRRPTPMRKDDLPYHGWQLLPSDQIRPAPPAS